MWRLSLIVYGVLLCALLIWCLLRPFRYVLSAFYIFLKQRQSFWVLKESLRLRCVEFSNVIDDILDIEKILVNIMYTHDVSGLVISVIK
jgi:hypothetical protein